MIGSELRPGHAFGVAIPKASIQIREVCLAEALSVGSGARIGG
jgi:hypothetical protein